MKKLAVALILALVLCGCGAQTVEGPTETVWVLAQSVDEHYLQGIGFSNMTLYTYDENGNVVEELEYDGEGELTGRTDYVYDDRGNQVDWKYCEYTGIFPVLRNRSKTTYDAQNRAVEYAYYDGWKKQSTLTYTYDEDGRTRSVEHSDGTRMEYLWDDNGRETSCEITQPDGTVSVEQTAYVYDEKGNILRQSFYTDGELNLNLEYTYDDQGRQIRCVRTDSGGTSVWEYRYDDEVHLFTTVYPDGRTRFEYSDENGNVIRVEHYDEDGSLTGQTTNTYRVMDVPADPDSD